ncbi:T9SS type A sorting domain-containing protein [candidate division KSB1 bacterium]|nr:T9SS type A sorting domain-containing protein [candidate division KSB1 bacterium]
MVISIVLLQNKLFKKANKKLFNITYFAAKDPEHKEWDKTSAGSEHDAAFSVRKTSDGGYILAGITASFGTGDRDFWLIKLKGNGVMVEKDQPKAYSLLQNYPNPFNPTTTIKYSLPKESKVTLKIFNILGGEVATLVNEHQPAGYHQISWDASGYSSGIYFYQIQAGEFQKVRKMVLLK